ncbi:MAG: hypothetical protein AAGL18_10095 [Pseudomonadota bacterium]
MTGNAPSAAGPVAYIDLEASGLGDQSWPIEVGWAVGFAAPVARLIRPHPDWPLAAWDPKAATLHGIDQETLNTEGEDPVTVCKQLNNALAGHKVYSDAPDWDGYWLYRLHSAARMKQTFSVFHFGDLMPNISLAEKMDLVAKANAIAPHVHRAADDVVHMQTLHQLVLEDDPAAG